MFGGGSDEVDVKAAFDDFGGLETDEQQSRYLTDAFDVLFNGDAHCGSSLRVCG